MDKIRLLIYALAIPVFIFAIIGITNYNAYSEENKTI